MTRETITDGKRLGQLLASELDGPDRGPLGTLEIVDADPDVEPTADGAFAYGIDAADGGGSRIAAAYVQSDRLRIEFETGVETALEAAGRSGIRVRPKATEPPRTLVFVESGANVKRALRVFEAVLEERLEHSE